MNKSKVRLISEDFIELVKKFAKDNDLVFDQVDFKVSYSDNSLVIKGVKLIEAKGKSESDVRREEFNSKASLLGISPDAYYADIMMNNKTFKIVDIDLKQRINKIIIQDEFGTRYKTKLYAIPAKYRKF
jgi:arginine deiminase